MSIKSRLKFIARHGPNYIQRASRAGLGRSFGAQPIRDVLAGFDPIEADLYRQLYGSTHGLISNYYRETDLFSPNGYFGCVTTIKSVFASVLEAESIPTPEVFAAFQDGKITWRANGRQRAEAHLKQNNRLVLKPNIGSQGESVRLLDSLEAFENHAGGNAILTAFVQQDAYAQEIFPRALNTIRAVTVRNDQNQMVLISAAHRFGTAKSVPVDNTHAGGLVSNIDLETGTIGKSMSAAQGNKLCHHTVHPDTQAPIEGVIVPNWSQVKELVQQLGRAMPYLKFVGWDIAMTKEGPIVIEGNSQASLTSIQYFERLSENRQMCQLLAAHVPNCGWLQEIARDGH